MMKRQVLSAVALVALLAATPAAHAQFAVIDVASVAQLLSEVQTLEQQVETARNQLAQAQSEYRSITGARGMQQLLAGTPRNYLPTDWAALQGAAAGSGGYPALAADLQGALRSNGLLPPQQLIDAIARANDQKAILELQARIAGEQGMLQNEHTKLQVLYQAAQAQEWANVQRARELTVSAHGQFEHRFRP